MEVKKYMMENKVTGLAALMNIAKRFLAVILLFICTNSYSQIIDENFERTEWQTATGAGSNSGTTTGAIVINTVAPTSTAVTYFTSRGSTQVATSTNTTPYSGNWWYEKGNSTSDTKMNKIRSISHAWQIGNGGYLITPVTKSAFVSMTFWVAGNGEFQVGINTNSNAGQPSTWATSNGLSGAGFNYATQSFSTLGGNSSITSYSYTGTFSGPARIGFFNFAGGSINIDDITIMGPTGTPPTVVTNSATPTQTTAVVNGTITPGTMPLGYSGFIWSTSNSPMDISVATKSQSTPAATGSYSYTITGLSCGVTYYYRSYVIDLAGNIIYGGIQNFVTPACTAPLLTTTAPFNIGAFKANSGGTISDSGGVAITQKGVIWSTSPNPTTALTTKTSEGPNGVPNPFTSAITGLQQCTTYYVRAYAINSLGTSYGNEVTFSTDCGAPALVAVPTTLNFGNLVFKSQSPVINYSLTGYNLSPAAGDITVTSSSPVYTISLSSTGPFTGTLTIPYVGGGLAATTIYVRMSTASFGQFAGQIMNTGGGASALNSDVVSANGAVVQNPSVTTNVGTDFWTGFGYVSEMNQTGSNIAKMELFIAVPEGTTAANVVVETPGISGASGFPQNITVNPGSVSTVNNFPTGTPGDALNGAKQADARLYYTGVSSRGIHVYSTNGVPVSVWMHTWAADNTAAGALLFPSNTWSSDYIVQAEGGDANGSYIPNSFFFVIAKEDNTPIWFKPSQNVLDSSAASIFNQNNNNAGNIKYAATGTEYGPIYLNKGQVFNAMGAINGSVGLDLSGSTVRTSCDKKIGVFGGNGRVLVNPAGCSASTGSDNMIQQMLPNVAWGTKYLTVPTKTMEYNQFRIYVSDPTTNVWLNDPTRTSPLPISSLINSLYYEIANSTPNSIESDKPINVTQFIIASDKGGSCSQMWNYKGLGDPEMINISPVQQAINNTTVFSSPVTNGKTAGHYINVVIPSGGVSSFRLDGQNLADTGIDQSTVGFNSSACYGSGGPIPIASAFVPHPQDPNYSYAKLWVSGNAAHTLSSDTAFNAIAYGVDDGESYGYNAGAAVNDLSQYPIIMNAYGSNTTGLTCSSNPFRFRIAIPYAPSQLTSLVWDFYNNGNLLPNSNAVTQNFPTNDSSFVANSATYYVYSLPTTYQFATSGSYPVKVGINTITTGGCVGNSKELLLNLTVTAGPKPDFSFTTPGCGNLRVDFKDLSTSDSTNVNRWEWNFGDLSAIDHTQNPSHTYATTSTYNVGLRAINEIGCYKDTVKTVDITGALTPKFVVSPSPTICAGATVTFTDQSTSVGTTGTIVKWHWDFGDASTPIDATTGANQSHQYSTAGTFTASLTVTTSNGCVSTPFTQTITVGAVPAVNSAATVSVCSGDVLTYNITSTVSGTTYAWSRAAVAGISNSAAAGTSNPILETLVNSTTAPVNVTYVITPTVGSCPGNAFNLVVTVNPKPSVSSSATGSVCSGTAQSYTITSATTGATFSWSRAAVTGITPATGSGTTASITETLTNTTTAPIPVTYVITPTFGTCSGTPFNYVVTVNPAPVVTSSATGNICSGTSVNYTIAGTPSTATFAWTRALVTGITPATGSGASNPISEVLTNASSSPVAVTYVINASANGCASIPFNYVITVDAGNPAAPVVSWTSTPNSITFTWTAISGATGYEVSVDGGTFVTPSSGVLGLTHVLSGLGANETRTLVVKATTPCQSVSSLLATGKTSIADNGIYIPNTFTPNGDGKNDVLMVYGNLVKSIQMKIFNQWGQLIFTNSDVAKGWDGTASGSLQPVGVYVYVVVVELKDGITVTKKGLVNLIR